MKNADVQSQSLMPASARDEHTEEFYRLIKTAMGSKFPNPDRSQLAKIIPSMLLLS